MALENPQKRRLTCSAAPVILAIMVMNALPVEVGFVVVVVTDGHAAGTCRA